MKLFPHYTRVELELCYQQMLAAIRLAAEEKLGAAADPDAVDAQVRLWCEDSQDSAVKATVMRRLRLAEGTIQ